MLGKSTRRRHAEQDDPAPSLVVQWWTRRHGSLLNKEARLSVEEDHVPTSYKININFVPTLRCNIKPTLCQRRTTTNHPNDTRGLH